MKNKFLLILIAIVLMVSTLPAYADSQINYIPSVRRTKAVIAEEQINKTNIEAPTEIKQENVNSDVYDTVPAIMYHLISDNPADWSEYCISSRMFEDDLEYIKSQNYTPIFASEYNLLRDGILTVKNPILLTFDDGYASDLNVVVPILEKHEIKANFFIIGGMIKEERYGSNGHMTRAELKKLSESKYVEIGNHSYELHLKPPKELEVLYNNRRQIDIVIADFKANEDFIEKIIGKEINTLSFPYGMVPLAIEKFKEDLPYVAVFSSGMVVNYIYSGDYILGRYNRPNGIATKTFFDEIPKRALSRARVMQSKKSSIIYK